VVIAHSVCLGMRSQLEFTLQSIQVWGGAVASLLVALVSGSSGLRSSTGLGHSAVFLGKTFYSHSASLHLGVKMGTGELNADGNPAMN